MPLFEACRQRINKEQRKRIDKALAKDPTGAFIFESAGDDLSTGFELLVADGCTFGAIRADKPEKRITLLADWLRPRLRWIHWTANTLAEGGGVIRRGPGNTLMESVPTRYENLTADPLPSSAAVATEQNPHPRRRMTRAQSGYHDSDAALVARMHEAIQKGEARNRWAAADLFADEAAGSGERERKQRRLSDRYAETYGDTEPDGPQ